MSSNLRILLVIVLLHVIGFVVAIISKNIYLADSFGYLHQAENILKYGSWYAEDWNAPLLIDYFSYRTPGYAVFIILCQSIWNSVWSVILFQNFLSIITCYSVVRYLSSLQINKRITNSMMLLALLLYPLQVILSNMVMSEILFQFLLFRLFLTLSNYIKNPKPSLMIWILVWTLLLLITKPVALLIPIIVASTIVHANYRTSLRNALIHVAWVLLSSFLLIHAVCLQQQHQTGYYHFSSIKPITQQRYYARYVLANQFGQQYADEWNTQCYNRLQQTKSYKERYELMQHMGDSVLKLYPFTTAYVYAKGVLTMLLDPGRHELAKFTGWDDHSSTGLFHATQGQGLKAVLQKFSNLHPPLLIMLLLSFLWNVFGTVLLLFFTIKVKQTQAEKWIVLSFIFYIVLATGMLGVARYRSAIFPLLIIIIALSIQQLYQARKKQVT